MLIVNLLPIFIVVTLLVLKKHMLVAGLAGAAAAVVISFFSTSDTIELAQANSTLAGGVGTLLGFTTPILYAATAAMLGKAGCFKSAVVALQRVLGGKIAILAAAIVIIQAFATYMAGMGAGNTMVIAPLMMAVVGANPWVIAGMALATAVCFTTSPSSTETILAAEYAGVAYVGDFAATMMPFTIGVVLFGAALAFYGVYKKGSLIEGDADQAENMTEVSTGQLFMRAIPAITMLTLVVLGGTINGWIGTPVILPFVTVIFVSILTLIFTPIKVDALCDDVIDSSKFILTTLFGVGVFLGFINIIALSGVFDQLAELVGEAPGFLVLPTAMIFAFLIAVPSGAFVAGVLPLILPTLALLGLSPMAMGMIAISAGFGSQISPVQINVAALAGSFKKDILWVVKSNLKFVLTAFGALLIISLFIN